MRWLFLFAGVNGFIAVAAGAFGAHALRDRLDPKYLDVFETAARYQLVHALAMLIAALVAERSRWANWAGMAFGVGVVLFSGSLYALALSQVRVLGAITPFGGAGFLAGWAMLVVAGWQMRRSSP